MKSVVKTKNSLFRKFMLLSLTLVMMFSCTISVFGTSNISSEQADKNLTSYVSGKMSQNTYEVKGGGSMKGSELFEGKATEGYDLKEKEFNELTNDAQQQVVTDIAEHSQDAIDDDSVKGVTDQTVNNWWKDLQNKKGVGSKFLNEILKNVKPDFATANYVFEPFAGPLGVVLGFLTIVIMGLFALTIVLDILYIAVPMIRGLLDSKGARENGGKGGSGIAKIVSHEAVSSVEEVENGQGKGNTLLKYFIRRIGTMLVLSICLLYLVSGRIWTPVGAILDLVANVI